jgi:hypothetical protein
VNLTDEPIQFAQCDATKNSQRWEDKEVLMLLYCYEKFVLRFGKKRVRQTDMGRSEFLVGHS